MPDTTIPDSHRDLVEPAGFGAFVTLNADGFPQATRVSCFVDEDGAVKVSINSTRHKLRNLRERPACTLLALDAQHPMRTLEIRARARVVPDDDLAIIGRLLAALGSDIDIRAMDGPGVTRYAAVLDIVKVNTTG